MNAEALAWREGGGREEGGESDGALLDMVLVSANEPQVRGPGEHLREDGRVECSGGRLLGISQSEMDGGSRVRRLNDPCLFLRPPSFSDLLRSAPTRPLSASSAGVSSQDVSL